MENDEKLARELHKAVKDGADRVRLILREGADPNHRLFWSEEWLPRGWPKYPPLHTACRNRRLDIVKILIQGGAHIDISGGEDSKSPLHCACAEGGEEVAVYLIRKARCVVDVREGDGKTPLHRACERGCKEIVQCLVEKGKCSVDVLDKERLSPLDYVTTFDENCFEIAHYLVNRGCGGDRGRELLLCGACRFGKLDLVKELIENYKIDPNGVRRGEDNWSPLHYASEGGHKKVVQYLLEKASCDTNVYDISGRTPLHVNCFHRNINLDVVQCLVERGHCDIDEADDDEMKPRDLAKYIYTDYPDLDQATEVIDYLSSVHLSKHQTCPNCEESCDICCKSCSQCEYQFPSSKSSAKPDQEPKKNSANPLKTLQKKVDQLAQVGYDVVVLVHTDSSKSHQSSSSRRKRHTYRKYCSPGLAEKFMESPVVYNSWKKHCNTPSTRSTEPVQNSRTTEHAQSSGTNTYTTANQVPRPFPNTGFARRPSLIPRPVNPRPPRTVCSPQPSLKHQ